MTPILKTWRWVRVWYEPLLPQLQWGSSSTQCIWGTGPCWLKLSEDVWLGPKAVHLCPYKGQERHQQRACQGKAWGSGSSQHRAGSRRHRSGLLPPWVLDFGALELWGNNSGVHVWQLNSWIRLWQVPSSLKLSEEFQKCIIPFQ